MAKLESERAYERSIALYMKACIRMRKEIHSEVKVGDIQERKI